MDHQAPSRIHGCHIWPLTKTKTPGRLFLARPRSSIKCQGLAVFIVATWASSLWVLCWYQSSLSEWGFCLARRFSIWLRTRRCYWRHSKWAVFDRTMLSRNPGHRDHEGKADEFSLPGQATWLRAKHPVGVYGSGVKKTDRWLGFNTLLGFWAERRTALLMNSAGSRKWSCWMDWSAY